MTQERLRELENEWSGCGGWEAIVEIAGALRASWAENARLADEAARLRAALGTEMMFAAETICEMFREGDIDDLGWDRMQQRIEDLLIARIEKQALASPASESVARRAAERELTEAARELANLAATWFPTANECVAYRSLRAKLAAKEGAWEPRKWVCAACRLPRKRKAKEHK